MKLSTTIITLNEEKNLPRALSSVKEVADEIIVVDSGSTDRTVDIARSFGATVFHREISNYASQKNFAASKANGDWILSLDADEEIEPALAQEILDLKANGHQEFEAYSIPRKNIILGKFIKFSRWQPELDRHIWLWRKNRGKWVGDVHEEVVVGGIVGKMYGAKIHYQYKTVREFLVMMNRYSELDAKQRVKNGVKFSCLRFLIDPLYNFIVRYFYRLGLLDGWRGFVLSYLMAVYHLELWIKIWEQK